MDCAPATSACVLDTLARRIEATPAALREAGEGTWGFSALLGNVVVAATEGTTADAVSLYEEVVMDIFVYGLDRQISNITSIDYEVETYAAACRADKRKLVRTLRRTANDPNVVVRSKHGEDVLA